MLEEPGREIPQSAQNLQVTHDQSSEHRSSGPKLVRRRSGHYDVDAILEAKAKGEADYHLQTMRPPSSSAKQLSSLSAGECSKTLHEEQPSKNNSHAQKGPLVELRGILWKKLLTLRRTEEHRRQKKERARKLAVFLENLFGFMKQLLGQKHNGQLTCSKTE